MTKRLASFYCLKSMEAQKRHTPQPTYDEPISTTELENSLWPRRSLPIRTMQLVMKARPLVWLLSLPTASLKNGR